MHEQYKKEVEAYVDGEMNAEQSKRFEETLDVFPVLKNYLYKIQNQKSFLKQWWKTQKHH